MQVRTIALFVFSVLSLFSCQKDVTVSSYTSAVTQLSSSVAGVSLSVRDTSQKWYGIQFYSDPDVTTDTLTESVLINNGIAGFSEKQGTDGTLIGYSLPASHRFSGDSITLEAIVTNPESSTLNGPLPTIQVTLIGTNNSAGMSFTPDVKSAGTIGFSVGTTGISSLPSTATAFATFRVVKIALKGTKAFLYVDDKLITSLTCKKSDKLGTVQSIKINGVQYISCDRVRLLNSYTKKVVMKEEFNLQGKSNTIYY